MTSLPTLFKKSNTGAILLWAIQADGATITTTHGQLDGKLQTTTDVIHEGKNIGKANQTSAEQQAVSEATAKHEKQLKKGYVFTVDAARAGETDSVIEGGILPMLAPSKSYPKDPDLEKAVKFPCFFQPKLDGMRCIAIVEDGVCTLWSRTRKKITSVPHINKALEEMFPTGRVVPDGELYNHEFKDGFEDLLSILRKDEPDTEGLYLKAEYHVYDLLEQNILNEPTDTSTPFEKRYEALCRFIETGPIKLVRTVRADNMKRLVDFFTEAEEQGYEGGMARNAGAAYESGRRSKHLQKMKGWEFEEFSIIGINDGRGKDAGTVATFTCELPDGRTFAPRLRASYARRREIFQDETQWRNKKLTVRFKRWTSDGIPYIPIGTGIRDYE